MSPEMIIDKLIEIEIRNRKRLFELNKYIPKRVSVAPIELMRLVLEKKHLPIPQHFMIENKIKAFENTTI